MINTILQIVSEPENAKLAVGILAGGAGGSGSAYFVMKYQLKDVTARFNQHIEDHKSKDEEQVKTAVVLANLVKVIDELKIDVKNIRK